MAITLALVDDHSMVLEAVAAVFAAEPDLQVVVRATDGNVALARILELRPTLAVVDLMMPHMHGLEIIRRVAEHAPGTRTVALSLFADESHACAAFDAGATGYVAKQAPTAALLAAVRAAALGQCTVSPPLTMERVTEFARTRRGGQLDRYRLLSQREREVFLLAAEGHTNAAIAERLGIGRRTVESYRANVMLKLQLQGVTDLARVAHQMSLLPIID